MGKVLVVSRTIVLSILAIFVVTLVTPTTASAAPTDVVINELMYNPATGNDGDEFLELYNRGTTPVDLSGWSLQRHHARLPGGHDDRRRTATSSSARTPLATS